MSRSIPVIVLLVALGACRGIPDKQPPTQSTPPEPVRWLFAQAPAAEMGQPGDAQFAGGEHVLVIRRIQPQPIEVAAPAPPEPSIQVNVLAKQAKVTEIVEAEIFVKDALPDNTYRLVLTPEHPSVRIVGPSRFIVTGQQKVRARFTSLADGTAPVRVTGILLNGPQAQHPILETTR